MVILEMNEIRIHDHWCHSLGQSTTSYATGVRWYNKSVLLAFIDKHLVYFYWNSNSKKSAITGYLNKSYKIKIK